MDAKSIVKFAAVVIIIGAAILFVGVLIRSLKSEPLPQRGEKIYYHSVLVELPNGTVESLPVMKKPKRVILMPPPGSKQKAVVYEEVREVDPQEVLFRKK